MKIVNKFNINVIFKKVLGIEESFSYVLKELSKESSALHQKPV